MMSYFSGCHNVLIAKKQLFPMMKNFTIFFFFFFLVSFLFISISMAQGADSQFHDQFWSREEMVQQAGYGEDNLSAVMVTGTVLCEAYCSNDHAVARPIPGALVAIKCPTSRKWGRASHDQAAVTTDGFGDFTIDLPSHLHAIPNLENVCCVEVMRVPKDSGCKPAFVRKHKTLTLTSSRNGIRNYSAGEINFLHSTSKPSYACNKRGSGDEQLAS